MKKISIDTIHDLLSTDEVAGKIIRDVAGLEWDLELFITGYFAEQKHFDEFWELMVDRFSFAQKTDILRKMKFHRKMKSQSAAVDSLEKLRKLRNILAHSSFLDDKELNLIISDNEIRKYFVDFPKTFNTEVSKTKLRLSRLGYSGLIQRRKSLNKRVKNDAL